MSFSAALLAKNLPGFQPGQRLWVGFSGGLDSCVLLHALASLKLPVSLCALHINHQLSPNAQDWQQHCAAVAAELGVNFFAERVTVERTGRGLEEAARAARYAAFVRHIQTDECLVTAHHADDQAETLLLRLLRGAGPRGLAAMSPRRPLGVGYLLRPMLEFTREELEYYAQVHKLRWVEDESNRDTDYDRNFLRQSVLPLLRQRWPQLRRRFIHTAELCAENEWLLMEIAAEDLATADVRPERLGQSINLETISQWSVSRRHNLLRQWLRAQDLETPERTQLAQVEQQLITGRADAEAAVNWGKVVLHRYRGRLYVVPAAALYRYGAAAIVTVGTGDMDTLLPDGGHLRFEYVERVSGAGYLRADLPDLSLRWRQGGERCQPEGRAHSQTLKKLLQEYALEPWWREQLPLIYCGEQLAAAGDLWICKGFSASPGQPGYRLSWQLPSVRSQDE